MSAVYGRELEEEVKDKTSGDLHFQSILLSQLACKRADAIDEGKIEDDAEELHQVTPAPLRCDVNANVVQLLTQI